MDITLGRPIIRFGRVTSTMEIARELERRGAAEGTTVIADLQTHGRGRAGRSWKSPAATGLYCSMVLRPHVPISEFASFSIAIGLAICDALDPDGHRGLQLKWPNDVIVRGGKLAGVLIVSSLSGSLVDSAILGFGVNLVVDSSRPDHAISLAELDGQPMPDPFHAISSAITARYVALLRGEHANVLRGWRDRLAFLDQPISIQDGPQTHVGVLRGIDAEGALILETLVGVLTLHAGEMTRGPVAKD